MQRLLDDTAEAKAYQEELSALLGQQLSDTEDAEVEWGWGLGEFMG